MYCTKNFKTKKELRQAVEAWTQFQAGNQNDLTTFQPAPGAVTYFQPGPFGGNEPRDGTFCCEGPHYPQPHKWYATCTAKDGVIVKVK